MYIHVFLKKKKKENAVRIVQPCPKLHFILLLGSEILSFLCLCPIFFNVVFIYF